MNIIASTTNPKTGNTTSVFVMNGVFEKSSDGGVVVKSRPVIAVTDLEGGEIKRELDVSELAVILSEQQAAPFFAMFAAEYQRQKAAQAAAEARARGE